MRRELAIDGRVRYTKMVIRQAFLSLLKEQTIDKVTVADVCRLAEINRATFYRHYENPYGILQELEWELLKQVPTPQEGQGPNGAMAEAIGGLWEKKKEWQQLLVPNADPGLPAKLYQFLSQRLPADGKDTDRRFLLHGLSGLLTDWMAGGFQEPVEQMTAQAVAYFQDLTGRG